MKHLVETSGSFMFMDPETLAEIHATRPTVVTSNNFVEGRVAKGELKILGSNISEKATDEEFLEYWKENREIAVDAFLSKFGTVDEGTPLDEELMKALEEAVEILQEGDFQKDGKPKVGALDKLVEGHKVDTAIRDQFWEAWMVE